MATLYITEYERADEVGGQLVAPDVPPVATQAVTYTTTAASAVFNKRTALVQLSTDTAKAHIKWGTSPTATVSDPPIAAGQTQFFRVLRGFQRAGTLKVAAYDGSS